MNHTPGPWRVEDYDPGGVFWLGSYSVASPEETIAVMQSDDLVADAHLMAAAPDLYEVCETVLRVWDSNPGPSLSPVPEYVVLARKALAKARGELPEDSNTSTSEETQT